MAKNVLPLFALVWLITLAGGLLVAGGLGALTADANTGALIEPYRLAWTAWSLEVASLLVTLYALLAGPFRQWRATVLFFYATVTAILIPLNNSVMVAKGALPGSEGSDTRANVVAAGLIVIFIGNYVQAILAALHDTDEAPARVASDGDVKSMA